jgi:hypothetical protein
MEDKRITFILGAGASIPFIHNGGNCLSTEYLTEQISNRDIWTEIYDEFKRSIPADRSPEENFNVSIDDILQVIEKLKSINEFNIPQTIQEASDSSLSSTLPDLYGIGKITFEHILYLLNKVCNTLHDRKNSVDNILFDMWGNNDEQKDRLCSKKGWNYVPYLCREVLIRAIIDIWEACPQEQAIEKNRRFFTGVLEKFGSVSIYSLNYDPLLYESLRQIKVKGYKENIHEVDRIFETGFSERNKFNSTEFYLNDNVAAFFHGHVGFVPGIGKDFMYFEDTYRSSQEKRLKKVARGEANYYIRGPKGVHYNVHVTSGLEKHESLYDNPYACYILRFSEDIVESEYIVFIGSSLGDPHITRVVTAVWRMAMGDDEPPKNMLRLRKLEVGIRKLIIVTTGFDKLSTNNWGCLDYLFQTNIGRKIFKLVEVGITTDNENEVNRILANEGCANIDRNLCLYLKGTEQFFSDVWKIKDLFS